MENLNLNDKLIFDELDLTSPKKIVEKFIYKINESTRGMIEGTISEYNGPVESYKKIVNRPVNNTSLLGLKVFTESLSTPKQNVVEVDIQDELGKSGDTEYKYEFFLKTPVYDQYKYRICFIKHGVACYPVKVILEQEVADEINKRDHNSEYIYSCDNPDELEDLLLEIIYSQKIIGIMQELINIYTIKQKEE